MHVVLRQAPLSILRLVLYQFVCPLLTKITRDSSGPGYNTKSQEFPANSTFQARGLTSLCVPVRGLCSFRLLNVVVIVDRVSAVVVVSVLDLEVVEKLLVAVVTLASLENMEYAKERLKKFG